MNSISQTLSPNAIAQVLGERLRQARLNANLSQIELGKKAGLSRTAVVNAESGKVYLETFIALLQTLGAADQIDMMLPEQPVSPLQLAKLEGSKRLRASPKEGSTAPTKSDW